MALTIWDHTLGANREAAQEDIDRLQAQANALGRINAEIISILQDLRGEMTTIQSRYVTSTALSGDIDG